jgi:hypothetical protein
VTWRRACALAFAVYLAVFVGSAAAELILSWKHNSPKFVYDNFHVDLDPWQRRAMEAFDDPNIPRISLQACVGPGKTAVESFMGWKFLACHGDKNEHPRGAAISITSDNLRDNLWPELSKWQQVSPFLSTAFVWTKERIFAKDHPETWYLSARSWSKTATPEEQGRTLSGLHAKYVLVLVDESGGIHMAVGRACDQIFSTGPLFAKIVQSGNPNSLEGMLYAAATTLRDQWHVIRITGDPDDPEAWVHSPRVKRTLGDAPLKWAQQQIAAYGRENPWVMSSILGQFPPSSINALLSVDEVDAAMKRYLRPDAYDWAQKRLGVDVARYGDDRTVIFPRQGLASFMPIVLRHKRDSAVSVDIANRVMGAKAAFGSEVELFDATGGWAAGAVDILRAQGLGPIDVQFAAPAIDPRYANRRAEIWFALAAWVQSGGALPPLPELVAELTSPTYVFHKGKFLLEDKDLVKKRIGRSPDLADALALTFGMVELPGQMQRQLISQQTGRVAHDGDPYAGQS